MSKSHQKLPSAGPAREALRQKGQFWTPAWVADAMVAYAVGGGSTHVFDPAVGAGAFFRAAKAVGGETGRAFELIGCEVDANALQQARENELTVDDLANVSSSDFVLHPPSMHFAAIVANPPYIRHHRLSSETKAALRRFCVSLIGRSLDGRAGLHVYFLLRALQLLAPGGRLAFIMPADTCEGVFAATLWNWITEHYRLEAVVTFTPEASPFPGVDTNAVVFLITNAPPEPEFSWVRCSESNTDALKRWALTNLAEVGEGMILYRRHVAEGLATGFSRAPSEQYASHSSIALLGDFVSVMRGIATGANEFFFLTRRRADDLGIEQEFLLPAVGRTRDVSGDVVDCDTLARLDDADIPTLLFAPDGRASEYFSESVRSYLRRGEEKGLNLRTLIATRHPWYKMEVRRVPPFLFAYLGRRNARFLRNLAGVVPLTGFLCVYPRCEDARFISELWHVLNHPQTIANLALVGKSYGGGAIKVEPRALERLPLPMNVLGESSVLAESLSEESRPPHRASQPALIGM